MKSSDPNALFANTYVRKLPAMVKGKGVYVYDSTGKKYLDFGTGIAVNALGHGHPALIKALMEQGKKLLHVSNYYFTEPNVELARLLIKKSFGDKVFFCNSGTEANEAAIKFARKRASKISADKFHILSFSNGFHGRTYGALSATAQEKFHAGFGPMLEGFHYAPFNDIDTTRSVLDKHEYAAIIVEPVQGEGGVHTASREFLAFLRTYSSEHAIALIFDEIQCGMGRSGTLWAHEQFGVTPDLMTLAKPLGGGLPLGAVVCKDDFVKDMAPGDHGTTFGGNPLACALGCAALSIISAKPFLKNVRAMGGYLTAKLVDLAATQSVIQQVRGQGLLVGVQLDRDPAAVVEACRNAGLLVLKAGHNTVRFLPPLIVQKAEIDAAVKIFGRALGETA